MAVSAFQDYPLADRDRAWDGAAAEKRVRRWAKAEDEPNEKYRDAHVWYDSAKKDNFGSYKLLIADVIGGELQAVPRGVMAAAAVMQGSRGGADLPPRDIDRAKADRTLNARQRVELDRVTEAFEQDFQPNITKGIGAFSAHKLRVLELDARAFGDFEADAQDQRRLRAPATPAARPAGTPSPRLTPPARPPTATAGVPGKRSAAGTGPGSLARWRCRNARVLAIISAALSRLAAPWPSSA